MQKFYEAYQFYGYRESEVGGVLTTANQGIRGDTPLIVTYSEKRFFEWHEDDKSVNIRASSGSYGGGSEVLVCTRRQSEHCAEQTTSGFSNNK